MQQESVMSTPESDGSVFYLDREYVGVYPPPDVHFPTAGELLDLCAEEHPRGSLAYPPESPVFWIKYGNAVYWNEVAAQVVAHRELQRLGSSVRAPSVYYAFYFDYRTFIVMEYIPGETVGQRLEKANEAEKEDIISKVVLGISELHRIPVPEGSRPAAIDGYKIRHTLFDEQQAPRHYENVDQLEEHLNLVSS